MFSVIPTNGQTWLICGGRDFADQDMFDNAMSDLVHALGMPTKIIHGSCRDQDGEETGADGMATQWAIRHAASIQQFPADWKAHGKAAGPIRNQEMLDKGRPKFVVAFPGGRGTADMVAKARKAKIDVAEIKPNE